jgi:hypothetical protein
MSANRAPADRRGPPQGGIPAPATVGPPLGVPGAASGALSDEVTLGHGLASMLRRQLRAREAELTARRPFIAGKIGKRRKGRSKERPSEDGLWRVT